jgi:hypothetical protein
LIDVANLALEDGPRMPAAFAAYDSEPPPPPKLKSRGVIAMDITEQFTNAAQRESSACPFFLGHVLIPSSVLDMGQLIKDPYFTLFESVGALEVRS